MKIDAHQHFWFYQPKEDTWITDEMASIKNNFLPKDLQPHLQHNGFDGCVAVQARQTEQENKFLLKLAESYPWIKGVVGWVDLLSKNVGERLEYYKQDSCYKGVRHILQAESKGFMEDLRFIEGLKVVASQGLTYDILTTEGQLPELVRLVEKLPSMKLVIDHISKPDIKLSSYDFWAKNMKILSEKDNVFVKLSGMATEADWGHWDASDFQPYIDFCLEHFGPERLMFGSDWPVCKLAGTYDQVYQALKACLEQLSTTEQQAIFGKTAISFYNLN